MIGRGIAISHLPIKQTISQEHAKHPHALPRHYGYWMAWHIGAAASLLMLLHVLYPERVSQTVAVGGILLLAIGAILHGYLIIRPEMQVRKTVERYMQATLFLCSAVAVLITFGIVISLIFESLRFFEQVSFIEFLTGLQWSPQTAIRSDQAGQSGAFGAVPIFMGTFLVAGIAMIIAVPAGISMAVYLSEYASIGTRRIVKPIVEILAGIPTVVYGVFALLTVGPAIRAFAESLGGSVTTKSAMTAGLVMGIMIIPFISSLSDDVINAVPRRLRDGAYALGATKSEVVTQIVFPAALPGILGAILLGLSRAIGETMIVVMAAGRIANPTFNPFDAVSTMTVQLVSLLTGDQEFDSTKTLVVFALGLVLFVITLILNVIALFNVRRFRRRYA